MDLSDIATHAREFFYSFQRNATGDKRFWAMVNKRPIWVTQMVTAVHNNGKIPPDDYKYEMIVEVLDMLADGVDSEELNLEADIYTHELMDWLRHSYDGPGYVDEAVAEFEHGKGIVEDIGLGQWREKDEVAQNVISFLEQHKDDEEDEMEAPEGQEDVRGESGADWDPRFTVKRKKKK